MTPSAFDEVYEAERARKAAGRRPVAVAAVVDDDEEQLTLFGREVGCEHGAGVGGAVGW
jgi:hypothetical protein